MTYFTSDTHYWHTNVIDYTHRPFASVEEMNQTMIDNWNAIVHADDLVYHLGDFSFGSSDKHRDILEQLAGNIVFILGNHDRRRRILAEYHPVHKGLQIVEDGVSLYLRHKPQYDGEADRTLWNHADYHLCGHVHQHWQRRGNIINVGVDRWDFKPRTLTEILGATDECI